MDRRVFLRQIGKTLAVGIGAVAFPVVAQAGTHVSPDSVSFHCCANASYCGTCSDGNANYYCQGDNCPFCTGCQKFTTDCYDVTYPTCP
jgi:hypothetical protein